jgi:cytidyltransferase-like protein
VVTERLGVLGGTFDPIHVGHIAAAVNARHDLGLDRVLLVVANTPWQKAGSRAITSAEDRFAMVEAAVAGIDGLEASRMEIDRGGPSYTADTLAELAGARAAAGAGVAGSQRAGTDRAGQELAGTPAGGGGAPAGGGGGAPAGGGAAQHGGGAAAAGPGSAPELFLIVGTDVADDLHTWVRADEVGRLATLVIVTRPGTAPVRPEGWRVEVVEMPALDISSTDLRARVAAGRPIDGLVPPGAVRVIRDHRLYAG